MDLGRIRGVSGVCLKCIWIDLVWIGVGLRCIFVDLTYMFPKFQQALKLAESREKQVPTFFAFLPPLYRRFRPSGALQTIDIEEIYRFISKIIHFMPSGSVFENSIDFQYIFR